MKRLITAAILCVLVLSFHSCGIKTCAPPPPPGGYSYDWVRQQEGKK